MVRLGFACPFCSYLSQACMSDATLQEIACKTWEETAFGSAPDVDCLSSISLLEATSQIPPFNQIEQASVVGFESP